MLLKVQNNHFKMKREDIEKYIEDILPAENIMIPDGLDGAFVGLHTEG